MLLEVLSHLRQGMEDFSVSSNRVFEIDEAEKRSLMLRVLQTVKKYIFNGHATKTVSTSAGEWVRAPKLLGQPGSTVSQPRRSRPTARRGPNAARCGRVHDKQAVGGTLRGAHPNVGCIERRARRPWRRWGSAHRQPVVG